MHTCLLLTYTGCTWSHHTLLCVLIMDVNMSVDVFKPGMCPQHLVSWEKPCVCVSVNTPTQENKCFTIQKISFHSMTESCFYILCLRLASFKTMFASYKICKLENVLALITKITLNTLSYYRIVAKLLLD